MTIIVWPGSQITEYEKGDIFKIYSQWKQEEFYEYKYNVQINKIRKNWMEWF